MYRSSDSRTDFRLACSKPDERQRLHLLVVGVGFVLWARLRPVVVPVQEDDTAAH